MVFAPSVNQNSHEDRHEFFCTFLNDGLGKVLMSGVQASSHLKLDGSSLSIILINLILWMRIGIKSRNRCFYGLGLIP